MPILYVWHVFAAFNIVMFFVDIVDIASHPHPSIKQPLIFHFPIQFRGYEVTSIPSVDLYQSHIKVCAYVRVYICVCARVHAYQVPNPYSFHSS